MKAKPISLPTYITPIASRDPSEQWFQLVKWPPSIFEVTKLFRVEDGEFDWKRIIWTSENCCLSLAFCASCQPWFRLTYASKEERFVSFYIEALPHLPRDVVDESFEELVSSLGELPYLSIAAVAPCSATQQSGTFPLSDETLIQVLRGRNELEFSYIHFNSEQCQVLASSFHHLTLAECTLENKDSFIQAFNSRRDDPGNLTLKFFNSPVPFEAEDFRRLRLRRHQSLNLYSYGAHLSTGAIEALMRTSFEELGLYGCRLDEEGANHMRYALSHGHGPRRIGFSVDRRCYPCDLPREPEKLYDSIGNNSLHGLISLTIHLSDQRNQIELVGPLAKALRANRRLQTLKVHGVHFYSGDHVLPNLLEALADHQSLVHLAFGCGFFWDTGSGSETRQISLQLFEKLLQKNNCLEEINWDDNAEGLSNEKKWQLDIVPKLQYNFYSKRVCSLPASWLGRALANVRRKTVTITWMLLKENQDTIVELALARKRCRRKAGELMSD